MGYGKTRALAGAVAVTAFLAGCANVAQPLSALKPGSSVDDINGKFIDTVDSTKIDYAAQTKARLSLAEHADPKKAYPGESIIGPVDHGRLAPQQTVIYDPKVEEFIKQVVDRLLVNWKGKKPDIRIAFVNDTSEAPFVAESGPDGTMYFGLSAIRDIAATDELAFETAHELSHILLNHFARSDEQQTVSKAGNLAGVAGFLASNSASISTAGTAASATPGSANPGALYGLMAFNVMLNDVLSPAFSREQEREADIMAADLMVKAGYSPRGITDLMQRLEDQRRRTDEARQNAREAEAMKAPPGRKDAPGAPNPLTGVFGAIDDLWGQVKADHPDPMDREEDLNKYVRREYPIERRTRRDLMDAEYQQFLISVARGPLMRRQFAISAQGLLKAGRLDEAYAMAQHALGDSKDPAADARMVLYAIRKAQFQRTGNRRLMTEAVTHLEIAWNGPEANVPLAWLLADEYTAMKRYDAVDTVLARAGGQFGEPEAYLPRRVANWVAADRRQAAFERRYDCEPAARYVAQCAAALPEKWGAEYAAYAADRRQKEEQARKDKGEPDKGNSDQGDKPSDFPHLPSFLPSSLL